MTAPAVADLRHRTEHDADYQRVKAAAYRALKASVRQYVRDLASHDPNAKSAFIHRHTQLMAHAFIAAHGEGQKDYWQQYSATPDTWRRRFAKPMQPHIAASMRQTMAFATPSVAKMAVECETAFRQPAKLDDALAYNWANDIEPRLMLQADVTWSGFQRGFIDAGDFDKAKPFIKLYWLLDPIASHCSSCPAVAQGSPYDGPGQGPNQLLQTPGDGKTECGIGCKCDLVYGPPEGEDIVAWAGLWPVNTPLEQLWPGIFDQRTPQISLPIPAAEDALLGAQIRALDMFRNASLSWDLAREGWDVPDLPDMFDPDAEEEYWHQIAWGSLSPALQNALWQALNALKAWQDAGGDETIAG